VLLQAYDARKKSGWLEKTTDDFHNPCGKRRSKLTDVLSAQAGWVTAPFSLQIRPAAIS
jgi:hypothetical protein